MEGVDLGTVVAGLLGASHYDVLDNMKGLHNKLVLGMGREI